MSGQSIRSPTSRRPPLLSDFWMALAGEADRLEDNCGSHAPYVAERLKTMLRAEGMPLVDDIEDLL